MQFTDGISPYVYFTARRAIDILLKWAQQQQPPLRDADLIRQLGVSAATFSNWKNIAHRDVAQGHRKSVAALMGMSRDELDMLMEAESMAAGAKHLALTYSAREYDSQPRAATGGLARVPVVGEARLGDHGYYDEDPYPRGHGNGYIAYPSADRNAYALRCRGDSMRPRIRHGEFVLVEPNHPVTPGDEVVVRTKDGRSMIKILAYRRNGAIELHSINDDFKPITVELAQVEFVHYVAAIVKSAMHHTE